MALTISGTKSTTRTNLGLGSAATLDTGTAANEVIKLNSDAEIPAVDGSLITNLNTTFNSPAFYVYNNSSFSITDATWTTLTTQLDTATLNAGSDYSTTTGRFTPDTAGWYHIEATIHMDAGSAQLINVFAAIYRGGGGTGDGLQVRSEQNEGSVNANEQYTHVSGLVQLDGSSDYVYLQAYADDSSGNPGTAAGRCNFMGWLVYPTS